MVANRCLAPASKLYCFEQWLREDVRVAGADALELHHLYRAMDIFEAHKAALEQEVFFRVADLFSCDVELIFYEHHHAPLRDRRGGCRWGRGGHAAGQRLGRGPDVSRPPAAREGQEQAG
jgi:hypothetical protein